MAHDARIDNRMVGILKPLLIYEHPFLLQHPRLRIYLEYVFNERVQFIAYHDHYNRFYHLGFPKLIVDSILDKQQTIKDWVGENHKQSNIFALDGDHWVNFRRWSPRPWALDLLKNFALKIRQGKDVDVESKEFKLMLQQMPRGSQLPDWAKLDLRYVFNYVKGKGLSELQDILLEIKFNIDLEDEWSYNNDPQDIDTLWNLLRNLPDTNVEKFVH